MAHCLSCNSYVLSESALCASCCEHLSGVQDDHDTYGLHKREWNFRYKMIKGKLAETLVEQLFLSHKYNVFRYGMEYMLPGISASLKNMQPALAERSGSMPDFVVRHRLYSETYFVEVKFRADGCFSCRELDKNYSHEDALVIVVSKDSIKCLSVRELKEGQEITEDSCNYLADRPEFDLRKDVVVDFCDFAKTFFENAAVVV
ncbi:MAG TPA: hypothetical protein VEB42_08415 [Chitinophagaceae bacterium]|nr:hypothetical protein [Chitinophagaceae bacterium]